MDAIKGRGTQMQRLTLDSRTTAHSGWIKTVPNYETEEERIRLEHRGRDRQTNKADRKRGQRERQREHTLICCLPALYLPDVGLVDLIHLARYTLHFILSHFDAQFIADG